MLKNRMNDEANKLESEDRSQVNLLESSNNAENESPTIVKKRSARLENDSIVVSWKNPKKDADVEYHVETFRDDHPTGEIRICKEKQCKIESLLPSTAYCFKIWVVDSNGIAGEAMFTNEVATSNHLEVQIAHCHLNKDQINFLGSKLTKCRGVDEIELRDCKLDPAILENFAVIIGNTGCKIEKFSASMMDNIRGLFPGICKILKQQDVQTLNLTENNITNQDISTLQSILSDIKVTGLRGLDLSNNTNLGNLKQLGCFLVQFSGLTDLTLMSCELIDEQLEGLSALHYSTLESLNISYNSRITERGLRCLKTLFHPLNLDSLDISGCEITHDKLLGLKDLLRNREVLNLNISYNEFLYSEMKLLGEVTTIAKVHKISVAGCDLDGKHLRSFTKSLGDHKLERIDASDNSGISDGMEDVAKLAMQCSSLDVSESGLQPEDIDTFCNAMNGYTIEALNVSDSHLGLTAKNRALKSLCNLIPIVKKRLFLCFKEVDAASRNTLQTHLESSQSNELAIVFDQSLNCETQHGITFTTARAEDVLNH